MFGRVVENLSKFLKKTFAKATAPAVSSRFVDLAPTSSAGNAGIYFEALEFATSNEEVHNIALTGPYGSGKSSVIKTFLARYPGKPLQLSLASFLPDSEQPGRVSKQEIERSILQQILYGVESGKLPFSRFKRIRTPERFSLVTSLLITIGLACAWYLVSKQAEVVSGTFFKPFVLSNWFNYFCLAAVGVLVWKAVHSAYTNSLSLSLKSISLKDVQIAPAATDTESILNRHLDEILYFFQSTEYDLVVIEDLDRFENPEIFITLREINGLINSNEGIKRRVRFLYALRDDIFANTDRTKFFEFIVPVIPIINHSNSVDKVVEHSQRIALDGRLNKQFVREVSRYLSDMRLIQNIFNEYLVYSTNLATDQEDLLDPNKLLAIIIYKNVIPADFAALHRQKGVLSEVLSQYSEYVATIERATHSEIAAVKALLDRGEQQILRDESDLRKVYAMAVIERIPPDCSVIATTEENYSIAQITSGARLENLLAVKSATVRHTSGYPRQTIDLRQLEEDVDPTRSFEERKNDISGKSAKVRKESEKRIRELETKISSLRTRRFNEVIRESAELIEHVFAQVGDHSDLLKYLILEGYLDDTYYQYISLFHSGRLSPNDNIFLIKIRAYNNPPPDFPLDNVAEVVASMRPEDFGQAYVLNRVIIDHMLADPAAHSERINKAIAYIAQNFELSRDLFRIYYMAGSHVDILVSVLTAKWPSFISVALEDTDAVSHVARILAYAPQKMLQRTEAMNGLRSFLAQNTDRILVEQLYFPLDRLRLLAIEVAEISKLADHQEALSFVVKEGLYRMSIENIKFILSRATGGQSIDALEKRHLSTLNKVNNSEILNRIELDFSSYVKDVLIRLEANTEEELPAILQVLLRNDVEYDLRTEFFLRQTAIFPKLSDIPPEFQGIALQGCHVDPTWGNCLEFMQSESYDPDILTAYLQSHTTSEALSEQPIPNGESALPLRQFIIANDALAPAVYRRYVRLLPNHFTSFQKVDSSKLRILIEEQKVAFTPENFEHLDDVGLQVLFVALNFKKYAADKSAYALDSDFRARLLSSPISDTQKLEVLYDLDETYITRTSPVAAVVGTIIARSPNPKLDYGFEFIKAVIVNSSDAGVQVSILNKLHHSISVPEVREILQILPLPFQDIAAFGKSPRLENNEDNLQLARWLSSRKVISSFTQTVVSGEIKINTFRKDST